MKNTKAAAVTALLAVAGEDRRKVHPSQVASFTGGGSGGGGYLLRRNKRIMRYDSRSVTANRAVTIPPTQVTDTVRTSLTFRPGMRTAVVHTRACPDPHRMA